MSNIVPLIKKFNDSQIAELTKEKIIPEFSAGDTVKVNVRISEGTTERIQSFQGVVIAKRNRGITSCFTVRKISGTEGVERSFMIYSANVKSVEVISRGIVRRAKLYYLRALSGKAAKVKQKLY
jgi:large subunit ribosomal protein L19